MGIFSDQFETVMASLETAMKAELQQEVLPRGPAAGAGTDRQAQGVDHGRHRAQGLGDHGLHRGGRGLRALCRAGHQGPSGQAVSATGCGKVRSGPGVRQDEGGRGVSHAVRATAVPRVLAALSAWFDGHADHAFHVGVSGRFVYHDCAARLDHAVCRARLPHPERSRQPGRSGSVSWGSRSWSTRRRSRRSRTWLPWRPTCSRPGAFPARGLVEFQFSRGEDIPPIKTNDATWQAGIQLSGRVQIIP